MGNKMIIQSDMLSRQERNKYIVILRDVDIDHGIMQYPQIVAPHFANGNWFMGRALHKNQKHYVKINAGRFKV